MPVDNRFYAPDGALTLGTWADIAAVELDGAYRDRPAPGVASAAGAAPGDVCFFEGDPRDAGDVSPSAAGCFVTADAAPQLPETVPGLVTGQPRLAHGAAASRLIALRSICGQEALIHPGASVHPGARLAPGVVIGAGAAVGEGTEVGAGSVIGPGVQIGRNARIAHHVSIICALIGDDVSLSSGVRIGEAGFGVVPGAGGLADQPHFGRVILQDGVSIGANTTVDRGAFDDTVIGERTKIDNLCQIAHNVRIGRDTVIAAFGGISGSVEIGDGVRLGGRAGVADHVKIGNAASLAAAAGVFRDVPDGETWGGTPSRPMRQYMREQAWLAKQVRERGKK